MNHPNGARIKAQIWDTGETSQHFLPSGFEAVFSGHSPHAFIFFSTSPRAIACVCVCDAFLSQLGKSATAPSQAATTAEPRAPCWCTTCRTRSRLRTPRTRGWWSSRRRPTTSPRSSSAPCWSGTRPVSSHTVHHAGREQDQVRPTSTHTTLLAAAAAA